MPLRRTLTLSLSVVVLSLLAARPARAQAPDASGVVHVGAAELARISDSLRTAHAVARVLGDAGSFQYIQVRRDSTGGPEMHARWTDVVVVQTGRAVVVTGGTLEGGHEESPGEMRGGRIVGGRSERVAAGDLLVIPAGLPHQVQVPRGAVVRYLAIKVPAPSRTP